MDWYTANEWKHEGFCNGSDPEAWFPEKGGDTRAPKKICRSCTIRLRCLSESIKLEENFGIWGGVTCRFRRVIMARVERAGYRPLPLEVMADLSDAITLRDKEARMRVPEPYRWLLASNSKGDPLSRKDVPPPPPAGYELVVDI